MKRPSCVKVCGLRVPVKYGTEKDHPDLKDSYGAFDLDTGVIWIAQDCPKHEIEFWAAHEALHALLTRSGALRASAAILGLDYDANRSKMDAWEEVFIRIVTPHVLETFGPARGVGR